MHEFCKYYDGTEVVFTDIIKNENGEETIQIHFERSTENGFDSVRFELPSYRILDKDGNYSDEEIEMFKTIVERSAASLYRWAKEGGIRISDNYFLIISKWKQHFPNKIIRFYC